MMLLRTTETGLWERFGGRAKLPHEMEKMLAQLIATGLQKMIAPQGRKDRV